VEADFNRREGLRPTVGAGRPKKAFFASVSAEADAWREAPMKADFNRRKGRHGASMGGRVPIGAIAIPASLPDEGA